MLFPDADQAEVSDEKLTQYLLNPAHPVGGPKAKWFETCGYTVANREELRDHLIQVARSDVSFRTTASPFGVKYEATGVIGCPGFRRASVVTIWIVAGNDPPRLVTAYPAKEST